jgi:hypothetical protein
MKLIVNADDLGLTAGVNQAILLGVSRGILSSASLMVNQDGTEAAIQYLRSGLIPSAGVHLCITAGRPVANSADLPSLVDKQGIFHRPSRFVKQNPRVQEIVLEFEAQIETVLRRGLTVTHLDTHHHIHRHPAVLEALITVARRHGLPVRHLEPDMREKLRNRGVATPDHFCGEWIGSGVSLENLYRMINEAMNEGHRVVELMTHPGLADMALAARSSYVAERQRELAILCSPEVRAWFDAQGITLHDYSCLMVETGPAGSSV